MHQSKEQHNNTANIARESYECKVAIEAINRAGKCPNLKGHVHEILFKDKFNINPSNILKGQKAMLTKSNTAKMKDIIILKGNKVAGHAQLKDTISSAGVKKTITQINSGHYGKTKVLGTIETVKKVQGKTAQQIYSSGISSETTTRIANKALGKMPTLTSLNNVGKAGGVVGAAVSAGIEAVRSVHDVYHNQKTIEQAAKDITVAGVKGGITGYTSAIAGSIAAGATGSVIATTGIGTIAAGSAIGVATITFAPVVVSFVAAYAIGSAINSCLNRL